MAYKLQIKRGLLAVLPIGISGEPLFTTDTNDLYIGNGTSNQRFQKYIASGTSSQFLKGDGSLDSTTYQPLLTNPVTGTGTTNYLPKWTSGTALGNSVIYEASGSIGVGTTTLTSGIPLTINSATGSNTNIAFQQNGIEKWYLRNISGTDDFSFYSVVNSSERLRITSGGNLLVGTTADTGERLQVTGTATFSSSVTAASFIKSGGTSSQYLMADGSVTTGGGGGSVDELQVSLICQVFG